MLRKGRCDRTRTRAEALGALLLLHSALASPAPLAAQDLQVSASAGWVDPGDWPRVFGGTGPAFRFALSRQMTDRVNIHGRFTWERLRTVAVDEPSYTNDLPPYDQPIPDGRRGMSMREGQVGVGFTFLPSVEKWDVEGIATTGMTALEPIGGTIFPSAPEKRWAATLGFDVARRISPDWWAFTALEARRIQGIDLTGLSDWEVNLLGHEGPHRRRVGSRWTGAVFFGIRTGLGSPRR